LKSVKEGEGKYYSRCSKKRGRRVKVKERMVVCLESR
jgi:hypothetical protein